MNHEDRIKRLEKELESLKGILSSCGLLDKFVPLSLASKQLNLKTWVIRKRIKTDKGVKFGKHYRLNGNRYLINVDQWRKLIAADEQAMRR